MKTRGALLSRCSPIMVCTAVLAGFVVCSGCSTPSREIGDSLGSTGGNAGASAGVGVGGQETSGGAESVATGGSAMGTGGVTAVGGTTSANGGNASGGAAGLGGAVGSGGAPGSGGASGSGGVTETGGGAGMAGNFSSGGASSGAGGDTGNAGASGSGGNSALGGQGGATGTGGISTGSGGAECDSYPGPCTLTWHNFGSDAVSTTTYVYDDLGRLVRTVFSSGSGEHYYYDEDGRLIESLTDGCNEDPATDATCVRHLYTYDEQGNLLVEEYQTNVVLAEPGCTEHTYDEDGLRLTSSFYEWCVGDAVTHITYEYDPAGQLVTSTSVDERDGASYTTRYTYNAAGQPVLLTVESALTDDYEVTYTYDEAGNETSRRILSVEGETEGEERLCYVKTYDDCGNELTMEFSNECDGQVTFTETQTYECFSQ